MGCDLMVHIWDESKYDELVIRALKHSCIGSRYFQWHNDRELEEQVKETYGKDHYEIISCDMPSFEIGEISFLKRALTDDDSYLYGLDDYVDLFNGDPEPITTEMLERAKKVDKDLYKFLKKHKKHKCFTVCW